MMGTTAPVRLTPYDFRQASGLSADQVRELSEHLSNLCRALSRTVPETIGLLGQFSLYDMQSATYDEYLDGLPDNPILALCDLGPASPPMVWQLDAAVAFVFADAMLGGGGSQPFVREGELTALERALVTSVVDDLLATLTQVWPALRAAGPRVSEVRQTSGRLGTESLQQALMLATLSCAVGGSEGLMRIGVPSVGVRPLLRQSHLRHVPRVSAAGVAPDDIARIGPTHVPVTVRLGKGVLTLREMHALQPGDILLLDRPAQDLVDVSVGGVRAFRGVSGLANGKVAVRVTGLAGE